MRLAAPALRLRPESLPPIAEAVEGARGRFELIAHWPMHEGVQLWAWSER